MRTMQRIDEPELRESQRRQRQLIQKGLYSSLSRERMHQTVMGEFEKKATKANIIRIEDIKAKLFNENSTSMTEETQTELEERRSTQVPYTANEMTPSKTQTQDKIKQMFGNFVTER